MKHFVFAWGTGNAHHWEAHSLLIKKTTTLLRYIDPGIHLKHPRETLSQTYTARYLLVEE